MPSFVLIDQSLRSVGGHPFDYAVHVLSAAQQAGYKPVLATHRKFNSRNALPSQFRVLPCFRFSTYSKFALYCSGAHLPRPLKGMGYPQEPQRRGKIPSLLRAIWLWLYDQSRERQLRAFARTCSRLFDALELQPGDHVFFATISEFEFIALSRYLGATKSASNATWHLQFHFNIFEGRPAQYALQQERLDWVRKCLSFGMPKAKCVSLNFYTTSQQLAEQYNQIGLVEFKNLPYPVNPAIFPSGSASATPSPRPLRVTCAGGVRKEKGQKQLAKVLGSAWEQLFLSGKLQLHVQSKPSHRNKLGLPTRQSADGSSPIVFWPHPLSPEKYVEFIRESDIGLLLYDSKRYYARRAGVLGEFLSAGIPVIVPSGCWLSEQIAEAGFAYLDEINRMPSISVTADLDLGPFEISEQSPTEHILPVPPGASALLVTVTSRSWPPGSYLGVSVTKHRDSNTSTLPRSETQVISCRREWGPSRALWGLPDGQKTITLATREEYASGRILVDSMHVKWIKSSKSLPISAVGIAVADEADVGVLLEEIAEHFEHYKSTALKFSEIWRREHDPLKTVQHLINCQPPSAA
jgi:glycosyltransferase involved in cell wall biosynthesis